MVPLAFAYFVIITGVYASEPNWWKSGILYQIYPRSFVDSNGDGNGDLKGVMEKVGYLKELGVGTVWLSPIYESPWQDMGYDISNYKAVHPTFGTITDAVDMIQKFHENGIRVLMDLVPNHSSDQHPWFNMSRYREPGFEDFYVWKDPKGNSGDLPVPPNNWMSAFGGSAWEWDSVRGQYYLHQFGKYQVDYNYANPAVVHAIQDVMRFWMDLGVDGFRVDTPHFMAEDPDFPDEPKLENCTSSNAYDCLDHIYTKNQPRTFEVLREFQAVFEKEFSGDKYMILEAYAPWPLQKNYYGPLMSPFNFQMINDFWMDTDAIKLNSIVKNYMENIPENIWPNWVLGNHDNTRVGSRLGADMADAANMLILLLPGTSITYQGEELGMVDGHVRQDQVLDCCSRDPERTPMQWDTSKNAGFSSGNKTWLPLNSNYWYVNAESEGDDSKSHWSVYRQLAHLRKLFVSSTDLQTATIGRWVFLFKRVHKFREFYILINLNNSEEEVSLSDGFPDAPRLAVAYIAASNAAYSKGTVLTTSSIRLPPRSGIVLEEQYPSAVKREGGFQS